MAFYFALFNMSSVNMEDARKKSQNYRKHKSRSCSPNSTGSECRKASAGTVLDISDSPTLRGENSMGRKDVQKGRKSRLPNRKSSDVTFEPLFKYGEELEKKLEVKRTSGKGVELGSISSGDSITSLISPYLSGSNATSSRVKAVDNYRKLPKPRVIDHSKLAAPGPSGVSKSVGPNSFYPRTRLSDIDECAGGADKTTKAEDCQSLTNSTTLAVVEDNSALSTDQSVLRRTFPIQKKVSFESPRLSIFKLEQNLQANFLAKSLQKTEDLTDDLFVPKKSSVDLLDPVPTDKKGAKNGSLLLPTPTTRQSAAAKSPTAVPTGLAKLRKVIKKIIEEQRNKKFLQALLDVGESGGKSPVGNLRHSSNFTRNLPESNQPAKVPNPSGKTNEIPVRKASCDEVDIIDTDAQTAMENEQNRLREKRSNSGFLGRNRLSTLRNSFRAEKVNSISVRRNLSDHNLQGTYMSVTTIPTPTAKPVVMRKKRFSMLSGYKSNRHSLAAGCEMESVKKPTPLIRRRSTTDKNTTAYRVVRTQLSSAENLHRSNSSLMSSHSTVAKSTKTAINQAYHNNQGSPKRPLPYTDSYCYRFNRCYEQQLAQPTPTQRIIPVSSTTVRTKVRRGRNSFQGWDNFAFNPSPDHRRTGDKNANDKGKSNGRRRTTSMGLHSCSSESFIHTDEVSNCVLTKYRSLNSDFNTWV